MATEILTVSVPIGFKDRMRKAAREDGRNLSNFVAHALEQYLRAEAMTNGTPTGETK